MIVVYISDKNSVEDIDVGSEISVSIDGQNIEKKVINIIIPATIAESNAPRINGIQITKLSFQVL